MENRIKETLRKKGYEYEAIEEKDRGYLERIDNAIQMCLEKERDLCTQLRENELSISLISRISGINRQTIHNRGVLLDYINQRIKEEKKASTQRKDNEIKELEKENETLHRRDAEYVELKNKLAELTKKYESLKRKLS